MQRVDPFTKLRALHTASCLGVDARSFTASFLRQDFFKPVDEIKKEEKKGMQTCAPTMIRALNTMHV